MGAIPARDRRFALIAARTTFDILRSDGLQSCALRLREAKYHMPPGNIVGSGVPRLEGAAKVTGQISYAADINPPDVLWGKILRSPYPHAVIRHIDTSKARELRGVRGVITGLDVKGYFFGKMIRDMPVLCWDRVRFVGDRVAAVAAESSDLAEEALGLISVEYEELPAVFDPLEAMQPSAVQIHQDVASYDGAPQKVLAGDIHNGLTRLAWRKGDIAGAFPKADLIFEHTFRIPARHQGYIEPHACVVAIEPNGRLQVWISTKQPFGVRAQLAKVIGIPEDHIRINVVHVGGDFGGKGDVLDLTIAYFLAKQTQRPLKIVMTSAEELLASNPAHATVVTVRSGVNRDGRIVARHMRATHASGAYGALKANASLSTGHYIGGPYRVDNASFEFLQIYTNTAPGGYFRGPGALATYFALESHTDIVARQLGIDPTSFRLMNLLEEGEEDAIGQRLQSVNFREVLQAAVDAAGWAQPKPGPNYGRGLALFGRHIGGGPTGVILTAERDGTFTVLSAIFDQGSGTHTILRQLVADEMRVPIDRVRVVIGDTDTAPYDAGTRASRMTYVAGRAALRACEQLRAQLVERASRILECAAEEVHYSGGTFSLRRDPGQSVELRRVVAQNGGACKVTIVENAPQPDHVTYICAQVAEVEVDPETGRITVNRIVTAHDVGTIMNPITHQGQIEGGVIMGLGHTLMEELVMDGGRVINTNLGDYKLPTMADIPKLETVLVGSGGGLGPYEAKSIGELVNNSAAAAIANAVADAVGVRLFELPITSERVYYALKNSGNDKNTRPQS